MPDWEQIAKYLAGECSANERAELDAWLEKSVENRSFFEAQKLLWEQSDSAVDQEVIDTEAGLNALHQSMEIEGRRERKSRGWLKYAAVIVMVLVSSLLWFALQSSSETVVINDTDKPMAVSLPDGSEVWLNRQAQLSYDKGMAGELREVELEGEAYFDIDRQPEKPFLIYTSGATVQVLGTEFNVKGDPAEKVTVDVLEGSVALYKSENRDQGITLEAFQVGVFNNQSGVARKGAAQNLNNIAWKTGVLRFEEETLSMIAEYLETHYATSVELEENLKSCHISTVFDNLSLSEVREVLELTLGIKTEETDSGVVFSGSCNR